MTDTTGTITYPPLERYEFTFIVSPDPRDAEIADLKRWLEIKQATADGLGKQAREYQQQALDAQARIAELEAALRVIRDEALAEDVSPDDAFLDWIGAKASTALMPPPERDMAITQEELDA